MTETLEPGVCFLFHGESKVGKSWLGASGPGNVCVCDAEGGLRFLRGRKKITWDGRSDPNTLDLDGNTIVVVPVRNFETMSSVYQWLNSGKHPFSTVVLDSLSEIQQRCVDAIAGVNPMKMQDWGDLLRKMSSLVRAFRDLTSHPTVPMKAVVFIAMTREINGRKVPYMQGQLATTLPYYIDVVGYYYTTTSTEGELMREMAFQPHPLYDAGDRTNTLGDAMQNPNLITMLERIHGKEAH